LTILDVDLTAFGLFYTTSREVVGAFSLRALYVGLHTTNGSDGVNAIAHELEVLDAEIEALIQKRQEARANCDFATADQIRDQLAAQGIKLLDTKDGVRWTRD